MKKMDNPQELNKEIVRRLCNKSENERKRRPKPGLLETIHNYLEHGVLDCALGKLADKFRAFVPLLDLDHPDLGDIFDGLLSDADNTFSEECSELITLACAAYGHNLDKVGPNIWKLLPDIPKEILRKIDSPIINRLHVRFLKNAEDREKVRSTKRMQYIDLRSICKKGEEVWDAQPTGFSKFIRFDTAYQEEMAKVEKKAQRYLDLGCTDLYSEVMKTVEAFKQQIEESYYGFNRITMTSAAVILAKSLEYTLYQPMLLAEFSNSREYRIVVEPKHFKKYNFFVSMGSILSSSLYATRCSEPTPVPYEPRVYPLYELWDYASETVKQIVTITDSFPEANNKAIFDHYGVIVPGVAYPKEKDKQFLDEDGGIRTFENLDEAKKALDIILIKRKNLLPIVVGEKDGKCYFICFWT